MNILIILFVVAIVFGIVRRLPKSSCTGNCNQGRNCTCQNTKWEK
jgi:hypothetical protein